MAKIFATNQPVKVKTRSGTHEHEGRAGVVIKQPQDKPGYVVVNFDAVPERAASADHEAAEAKPQMANLVDEDDLVELN